jgi:hypothetical protein
VFRDGLNQSMRIIPLKEYSLHVIIHRVPWNVEFTDQFEAWWNSLSVDAVDEQVEISAKVDLLQELGPTLPRPHADLIVSSRHSNMKELRR